MRILLYVLVFSYSLRINAKEWNNLRVYQKETQHIVLSPSDWLISDRRQNTLTWQTANAHNLINGRPQEYITTKQRRDFYAWLDSEMKHKGHEVVWVSMAFYISHKLRLLETFPHCIFINRQTKMYANQGGEIVFNNAFNSLQLLYNSEIILKNEAALQWDKKMLHDEQYLWIERIYESIDERSLKQIDRMAKGKFLYALAVPKAIRFEGDVSMAEDRYKYAVNTLRLYCKKRFK